LGRAQSGLINPVQFSSHQRLSHLLSKTIDL
jgi:hypothetical protein